MKITLVKVFPVNEEKLKAFVSVVFDNCFMVNDIKIIQGKDGLFLSMPSRRKKTGEFKDVAHPLNNEFRRLLEEVVLNEYREIVNDATPRRPDRPEDDEDDGSGDGFAEPSADRKPPPGAAEPTASIPSSGGSPAAARAAEPGAGGFGTPANPSGSEVSSDDPAPLAATSGSVSGDRSEPSLEEVRQKHLEDSFWSVRGRS